MYKKCTENGIYADTWKKSNIVSVRRKRDKQSFNNYRPVPLPPILGKIFEKMPFNSSRTFSRKHSTL